jgi:hypothetical protein
MSVVRSNKAFPLVVLRLRRLAVVTRLGFSCDRKVENHGFCRMRYFDVTLFRPSSVIGPTRKQKGNQIKKSRSVMCVVK